MSLQRCSLLSLSLDQACITASLWLALLISSTKVLKVGGFQITQHIWQAVFQPPPPHSSRSSLQCLSTDKTFVPVKTKPPAMQATCSLLITVKATDEMMLTSCQLTLSWIIMVVPSYQSSQNKMPFRWIWMINTYFFHPYLVRATLTCRSWFLWESGYFFRGIGELEVIFCQVFSFFSVGFGEGLKKKEGNEVIYQN